MWVFLAFSSINKRKWAVWMIWSCVLFTIYCVPWPLFFENQEFIHKICPIENWFWFALMVPLTFWYWLSLKWMDDNRAWNAGSRKL